MFQGQDLSCHHPRAIRPDTIQIIHVEELEDVAFCQGDELKPRAEFPFVLQCPYKEIGRDPPRAFSNSSSSEKMPPAGKHAFISSTVSISTSGESHNGNDHHMKAGDGDPLRPDAEYPGTAIGFSCRRALGSVTLR